LRRNRYQFGTVERRKRKTGPDVWTLRLYVRNSDGSSRYSNHRLGTLEELPTAVDAERKAEAVRMEVNQACAPAITFGGLIERYKLDKLPERYSTRSSYLSLLNVHLAPRWGEYTLKQIGSAPYEVEQWFRDLSLAPKTKGHIKSVMFRLFECAMKWGLFPLGRNPIELVEIRNVSKRRKQPRVLTSEEFWILLSFIKEPFRTMVLTAQCLGLRVSEVMALRWSDFCFDALTVRVQRGIVHGRVDDVKTEYSNDDLPLDPEYAGLMLAWKQTCPATAEDWVFPNPSTQLPYWQESVAKRHLRPAGVRSGLEANIGWHTFRHTYRVWLDGAGAPVSIQRDLMRHASIQTTMNVYGRATMSEEKRKANSNVVRMALRPTLLGSNS
jgi:integrase